MLTEITHITKPHPHDSFARIREVGAMAGGTVLWRCTLDQAVWNAEHGTDYYVNRGGYRVPVVVVHAGLLGSYLRTAPDQTLLDNLLSLPQLPPQASALAELLYPQHGLRP